MVRRQCPTSALGVMSWERDAMIPTRLVQNNILLLRQCTVCGKECSGSSRSSTQVILVGQQRVDTDAAWATRSLLCIRNSIDSSSKRHSPRPAASARRPSAAAAGCCCCCCCQQMAVGSSSAVHFPHSRRLQQTVWEHSQLFR